MSNIITTVSKTKRDSRVEALRLFACFSVLVLHFKPNTFINGQRSLARVFITCLCTDAVGIFLLITGFFYFGNRKYGKRISDCIIKILLPTLVYTLFIAICYPLMIGSNVNYTQVLNELGTTVFTWNPIIHNAQHLWYMYLHCLVVLAYPLLKAVKEKLIVNDAAGLLFIASVFLLMVANDASGNRLLGCRMIPLTVFIPGCLYTVAGNIIHSKKSRFEGKVLPAVISVAVFIITTAIRSVYMRNALNADSSATHLYGWYSRAGFVCCVSLAVFVLSIKPFTSRIVNALASTTMYVYILHVIVSEVISVMGYRNWVIGTFLDGSETTVQFLKFTIIYSFSIFAICAAITLAVKAIFSLFNNK